MPQAETLSRFARRCLPMEKTSTKIEQDDVTRAGSSGAARSDLAAARARESIRGTLFGRRRLVKCGRFEVRRLVGHGGMGEVYEGWDPDLERTVALKVLGSDDSGEAGLRRRLVREAQSLARLRHSNIVGVYEVGEEASGRLFIAMEYVEGETLEQWLNSGPREIAEILSMFRKAGEGLVAAHAAGIVHRDFKPKNVMVSRSGEPRVVRRRGPLAPARNRGLLDTFVRIVGALDCGTLRGSPFGRRCGR